MSITRLQQARQMYALGQRVAKTMDGSRPGYRGEGGYQGGSGAPGSAESSGADTDEDKADNREQYGAVGQYSGPPSSPSGGEVDRPNIHTKKGTSKTSVVTGDKMKSAARDFVQTLNTNNAVRAAKTGTKFTPYTNPFSFAPEPTKGLSLLDLALLASGFGLFGTKAKTAATAFNFGKKAKTGLETVTSIANQFGFENPIGNMFSGFGKGTSKGTTSTNNNTNNTNNGGKGDGEGLASLNNQASGYDEYILLLQKLQSGNISDSERNRFNVLKNMLGI
jgi:hypothetical protein